MSIPKDARDIYRQCFGMCGNDEELILGFAAEHGKIHLKYENGEAVNMICTCPITDGDFAAEYIFACATPKKHRGKGIFRRHLDEIIGNKPAVLIPENEELFAMYRRLGFEPIYHTEAIFGGKEELPDFKGDLAELYRLYTASCPFPKKSFPLFEAAMRAFISYGGRVKRHKNAVLLVSESTATEIFAPDAQYAISAAKAVPKALLPLRYRGIAEDSGIKTEIKCVAMARNIACCISQKIYINNLFN